MLTYNQIKPYLIDGAVTDTRHLHGFYKDSVEAKKKLASLFGDEYPQHMDVTRPKERKESKDYRKAIYVNPFANIPRKVSEAYDFIPNAEDFDVQFPSKLEGSIKEEETLKSYLGKNYSQEGEFHKWFFKNVPFEYLMDANAVIFTSYRFDEIPTDPLSYSKPRSMIAPCENVLMWRPNFAVVQSVDSFVFIENNQEVAGKILYFFDHESYTIAWQISRSKWEILAFEQETELLTAPLHYCPSIPVVKLGKWQIKRNAFGETLYESRLEDIVPDLKQAQQTLSDRCVERNYHTSSQEWRKGKKDCKHPQCKSGYIIIKDAGGNVKERKVCPRCKGAGEEPSGSGLDIIWVDDAETGTLQGQNRTDGKSKSGVPGGYIERDTKPLEIFRVEYKDLEESLHRKLNLQYIIKAPYNESGASKRYDREDSYRELNTQAEHFIQLALSQCICIDAFRYGPSNKQGQQIPSILVPTRFNLENSELTREELNDARGKDYDSAIIEALEEKFLGFVAGKQSPQYKRYVTQKMLDPYRGYTLEEKQMFLSLSFQYLKTGPKRELMLKQIFFSMAFDAVLSEVIIEDAEFYTLDEKEKRAKLIAAFDKYYEGLVETPAQLQTVDFQQQTVKPPINLQEANQILE